MGTHSSILAWRISWTEEPHRLQFMGSQNQTRLRGLGMLAHRSSAVMLILCWGTHFERTIVIGRSSSICKSRELKTWCIQKTLSSCLMSSGEDSSLPLPKTGALSLVKELRIFMPYGAAKKTSKNNLNKFQCEDMVRDKAGEEK